MHSHPANETWALTHTDPDVTDTHWCSESIHGCTHAVSWLPWCKVAFLQPMTSYTILPWMVIHPVNTSVIVQQQVTGYFDLLSCIQNRILFEFGTYNMNVIQVYYIHHVVIVMWPTSVNCMASLPFIVWQCAISDAVWNIYFYFWFVMLSSPVHK